MKQIENSKVMYKDINYISKKDNKEKSYKQFYIQIQLKTGDTLVYKVSLDYKDLKLIDTHLEYNGIVISDIE